MDIIYKEYYSHEKQDCYKINLPWTRYACKKIVLCSVTEGFDQAKLLALPIILNSFDEALKYDQINPIYTKLIDEQMWYMIKWAFIQSEEKLCKVYMGLDFAVHAAKILIELFISNLTEDIEMKDSIKDQLLQIGFLTGSRAFGGATDESDYDIVYCITDKTKVKNIIGDMPRTDSAYFQGYYITDENDKKRINVIPVSPSDYMPWFLATEAMKATFSLSGISNPIQKYALFQGLVAMYKGMGEKGSIDEVKLKIKNKIIENNR